MTFCVVEFSYFSLCKVPCREGLRPWGTWGTSLGEDKLGARDKLLNTNVARRACAGRAPGKHSPTQATKLPKPHTPPTQPLSLSQRHLQVVSMCNCSAWCMIARRVSKLNICRLHILHCLCQHGCEPEIFMFPRLSCVWMHLEMWAEVKVHSYHVHAHVCAGSCMYCAQATPLSKLQWA